MLTACSWDAHFHRQGCVQSGTLDHDTQHPRPFGGLCVQVGEHMKPWWWKQVCHQGVGFHTIPRFFVSLKCAYTDLLCGLLHMRRQKFKQVHLILRKISISIIRKILVLDVNLHFLCGQFCSTADNYQFLKGMKNFVGKSGHKLKICYEYMNRGDRWMQVKAMRIIEQ